MSSKKALIVDSDVERATKAGRVLHGLGYQVEAVADGWSALVCLQQGTPDLLLVQPRLSIVSGYEVARYARTELRLSGVRILMLADSSLTGPAAELADEVLTLPLQSTALVKAAAVESTRWTIGRATGSVTPISPTAAN